MLHLLLSLIFLFSAERSEVCLSEKEKELASLINGYRKSKGQSIIPVSPKLTRVAKAHARDLMDNYDFDPSNKCNPHSWSDKGEWTSCCYTNDGSQAKCMWDKPREIAGYNSEGYEIAFYYSAEIEPTRALEGWKKSPAHNPVIISSGIWKKLQWNAMGVAIQDNYALVWFGTLSDSEKIIDCSN